MSKASLEMQNQAAAIKLRAERRGGELLQEAEKNRGGQAEHKSYLSHDGTGRPTLDELGLNRMQSSRWQAVAAIPEPQFESYIQNTQAQGDERRKAERRARNTKRKRRAWW